MENFVNEEVEERLGELRYQINRAGNKIIVYCKRSEVLSNKISTLRSELQILNSRIANVSELIDFAESCSEIKSFQEEAENLRFERMELNEVKEGLCEQLDDLVKREKHASEVVETTRKERNNLAREYKALKAKNKEARQKAKNSQEKI